MATHCSYVTKETDGIYELNKGCVLLENFLNNELLEVTFSNWKEGLSKRVSLYVEIVERESGEC